MDKSSGAVTFLLCILLWTADGRGRRRHRPALSSSRGPERAGRRAGHMHTSTQSALWGVMSLHAGNSFEHRVEVALKGVHKEGRR